MKKYNIQYNIGRAKYCVNICDGVAKYFDGSEFWGICIFKNKLKMNKYIKELITDGYIEKNFEYANN